MKIPSKTVELTALDPGYTNQAGQAYYVKLPRTVPEAFIREFSHLGREAAKPDADPRLASSANVRLMEQVTEWNLDDDQGQVLQLVKDAKDAKDCEPKKYLHADDCPKLVIVGQVPLELIPHLAKEVTGQNIPEKTRDF